MRFPIAIVLLTACGGGESSVPATPRDTVETTLVLQSNDLVEATLIGGPGDAAAIELDVPVAKLDWNIHGHADGGTQVVEEEFGVMTVRFMFEPTAQADWSLLMRNKDAAEMVVRIKVDLFGEMVWSEE